MDMARWRPWPRQRGEGQPGWAPASFTVHTLWTPQALWHLAEELDTKAKKSHLGKCLSVLCERPGGNWQARQTDWP